MVLTKILISGLADGGLVDFWVRKFLGFFESTDSASQIQPQSSKAAEVSQRNFNPPSANPSSVNPSSMTLKIIKRFFTIITLVQRLAGGTAEL